MATFDRKSAERIAKVVGYVEKQIRNGVPSARGGGGGQFGFWAIILDREDDKYKWVQCEAGAGGTARTDWRSSGDEFNAYEQKYGSEWVLKQSVVWMEPRLTGTQGEEQYTFTYDPSGVFANSGDSGISASGDDALNSSMVQIYHIDPDDGQLLPADDYVIAWNPASDPIDPNKRIMMKYVEGLWIVDWENCPS